LPYTSEVEATRTFLLLLVRELQDHLRAVHVGLDGVDRALDDEAHAHRGRQVEDDVDAVDQLRGTGSLITLSIA